MPPVRLRSLFFVLCSLICDTHHIPVLQFFVSQLGTTQADVLSSNAPDAVEGTAGVHAFRHDTKEVDDG